MKKSKCGKTVLLVSAVLVLGALLVGCGGKKTEVKDAEVEMLPDYTNLLDNDPDLWIPVREEKKYGLPLNFYIDNTGSMQGFIFDENYREKPDPKYVHFMRSLRDLGKLYDSHYYVIKQNEETNNIRDWAEYHGSIYDNFSKAEFTFSWKNNSDDGNINGPLSKLYLEDRTMNSSYINIVLTDLAEQNVNNTHLAQQIQKMCENKGCTAYLFAFHFDYHGNAEVPNPDAISDIKSQRVDGPRPYYMLVTGPDEYIGQVIQNLRERMDAEQLAENQDYYMVSSKIDMHIRNIQTEDVIFLPPATLDEIKAEEKSGSTYLSRNLVNMAQTDNLFERVDDSKLPVVYKYEKVQGLNRKKKAWWLNFYVPLYDYNEGSIKYTWEAKLYYVKKPETDPAETGTEETETVEKETENVTDLFPVGQWEEETSPTVRLEMEELENSGQVDSEANEVYYFRLSGLEDIKDPREDVLVMLKIQRSERVAYKIPDWVKEFDTGATDEYFQKTYNLSGFYDILFGYQNKRAQDGDLLFYTNYVEIPIVITNIK